MTPYENLIIEREPGLAVVTINRPDVLDALSIATVGNWPDSRSILRTATKACARCSKSESRCGRDPRGGDDQR